MGAEAFAGEAREDGTPCDSAREVGKVVGCFPQAREVTRKSADEAVACAGRVKDVVQGKGGAGKKPLLAEDALRGIVLLNGGAIIALLTFFGQAWSKNENQGAMVMSELKTGLLLYIFGALAGILAQGLAYLAQQNFVDGNRRLALNFRRFCIAVALSGMYFFGHGSLASVSQFITQ